MYIPFKNGKPAGNKKFTSYEAARQQVRKWIRKSGCGTWFVFGISNPALFDGDYTIRRVNG